MNISILTLFPQMFTGPLTESIIKRAIEKEKVHLNLINIRDFATDKHHTTDQPPYGGGPGMVMMVEPIAKAIESLQKSDISNQNSAESLNLKSEIHVVLLSAKGSLFTQQKAREFSKLENLVLICGHYEGVDERVVEQLIDEEIRVGDYVLTGGEIPAMVITDSVVRLLPGVLGDDASSQDESHSDEGTLEYPQYTRPEEFNGWTVPSVLLSGNHAQIERWRTEQKKHTQDTSR